MYVEDDSISTFVKMQALSLCPHQYTGYKRCECIRGHADEDAIGTLHLITDYTLSRTLTHSHTHTHSLTRNSTDEEDNYKERETKHDGFNCPRTL